MLIVFWNMKGPINVDFLEKGSTVNTASYCKFFWQNSPDLLNDSWCLVTVSFLPTYSSDQLHIYIYIYSSCHKWWDYLSLKQYLTYLFYTHFLSTFPLSLYNFLLFILLPSFYHTIFFPPFSNSLSFNLFSFSCLPIVYSSECFTIEIFIMRHGGEPTDHTKSIWSKYFKIFFNIHDTEIKAKTTKIKWLVS